MDIVIEIKNILLSVYLLKLYFIQNEWDWAADL
jgi:hypothetical protein